MLPNQNYKRPPLLARFKRHMAMNELIRMLRAVYEETPSEKILMILNKAEEAKLDATTEEQSYFELEMRELLENLHLFPHSIRTAALNEDLQ